MDMPTFDVPQFYETVIATRGLGEEHDAEFRFLCLPRRMIHPENQHLLDDPERLLSVLGLEKPLPLAVGQIPVAIFALLHAEALEGRPDITVEEMISVPWPDGLRQEDPRSAMLADYLAFAEVVPFEQSSLKLSSLTAWAQKSFTLVGEISSVQAGAVLFIGPHAPVAFAAVGGAVGVVAIVDGIGALIGLVTSPRTDEVVGRIRRGFRRLIHRPAPDSGIPAGQPPEPPAGLEPEPPPEKSRYEVPQAVARKERLLADTVV